MSLSEAQSLAHQSAIPRHKALTVTNHEERIAGESEAIGSSGPAKSTGAVLQTGKTDPQATNTEIPLTRAERDQAIRLLTKVVEDSAAALGKENKGIGRRFLPRVRAAGLYFTSVVVGLAMSIPSAAAIGGITGSALVGGIGSGAGPAVAFVGMAAATCIFLACVVTFSFLENPVQDKIMAALEKTRKSLKGNAPTKVHDFVDQARPRQVRKMLRAIERGVQPDLGRLLDDSTR